MTLFRIQRGTICRVYPCKLSGFVSEAGQSEPVQSPSACFTIIGEELRRFWIAQKGWRLHTNYVLDTKPVPEVGYKRQKSHSEFAGNAEYGKCTSRNLSYFGYKLVVLSTLDGIPVAYELLPANLDERLAAEAEIDYLSSCDIFADKGFLGFEWQTRFF
jgi:hypothetical protein